MGLKILKSRRALLGLTQGGIANLVKMNIKSYNLKENGKREFTLEEINKLSKVLNLTLDEVNEIFLHIDYNNN